MDAKLTLNIDKEIASKAKLYAKSKGSSLSGLIENYLKLLTRDSISSDTEYTPAVKSLLGSVSLPADFDYKRELSDYLTNKYLSND